MGLANGTIALEGQEEKIFNSDHRYRWNWYKKLKNNDDQKVNKRSIIRREVFIGPCS
jgi:hypothetical protein